MPQKYNDQTIIYKILATFVRMLTRATKPFAAALDVISVLVVAQSTLPLANILKLNI